MKVNNGPKKNTQPDSLNANIVTEEDPAPCSLNFNGLKNANAISTSEIVLTWDAAEHNCNTVIYKIYDYANLSRAIGTSSSTSYTATNLESNKEYTFRVKAFGNDYEFPTEVIKSATTLSTNPLCDLTFAGIQSATASGTNGVILSWNAATGCDEYTKTYRVYQNSDYYSPVVETTTTTATLSGLTLGSLHSFVVRPVVNGTEYSNLDVVVNYGIQRISCTGLGANTYWNNANTIYQTWNGSSWTPTEVGTYSTTSSSTNCYYACNTNYTRYNNACVEAISPSAVTLHLEAVSSNQVTLAWYAPGDNGNSGTAGSYDIRYSTSNITSSNFSSATQATGEPTPSTAGTYQQHTITGLTTGNKYYFALKSADAYENGSDLSNVVSTNVNIGYVGQIGQGQDGWYVSKSRYMYPQGATEDSEGNILVADRAGNRIIRFSSNGNFLGWLGNGKSGWQYAGIPMFGSSSGEFYLPNDVKVDSTGNIYASDTYNHRIQKWNSSGIFQGWIGGGNTGWQSGTSLSYSSNDRYFYNPQGFSIDNDGNLIIADTANNRVQKWASNGAYIGWIGNGNNGWQTGAASSGTEDKQFSSPYGTIIDSSGNIYVCDTNNHRVQKWTSAGVYVGWIGGGSNGWQTGTAPSNGTGDAEFYNPRGIAIDTSDNLHIADYYNNRIQKWTSAGNYVGWIGNALGGWQTGTAPGTSSANCKFQYPQSVNITSNGSLLITDTPNYRVQKWTSDGLCQGWINGFIEGWQNYSQHLYQSSTGDKTNYFYAPKEVTGDTSGNVYVADFTNHRVVKYGSNGTLVGWIGGGTEGWHTGSTSDGKGDKYIGYPYGIYYHTDGYLYIAEAYNDRLSKWSTDGTNAGWIGDGNSGWQTGDCSGDSGTGDNQMYYPRSVVLDSSGNIFIGDALNYRVQKWTSAGSYVGWIGGGSDGWQTGVNATGSGSGDKLFNGVVGISLDTSGNIFVTDMNNHRIQKWTSAGTYVGWVGGGSNGWQTGSSISGTGTGYINYPYDVNIDSSGNLRISDYGNSRIAMYTSDGNLTGYIGKQIPGIVASPVYLYHAHPNGYTQTPGFMWMDSSDVMFIIDVYLQRLLKFK